MKHMPLVLASAALVVALLSACQPPAPAVDLPSLPAATEELPAPAAVTPSEPTPEDMPTAAPLWTSTPEATPLPPEGPTPEVAPGTGEDGQPELEPYVAAEVNGQAILRTDFDRQLAQAQSYFLQQPGLDVQTDAGQASLEQFQTQVLGWLIDQALIEQAAAAQSITISDATVDAEIAHMRGDDSAQFDAWLSANGLTIEGLREQLRLDLVTTAVRDAVTADQPRQVLQIHVRHILTSDESIAQAAVDRIRQGGDFATIAREVSEDEATRGSGGDLGYLPRGTMPPAFEEAAFALGAGETSGVVRSEFGFHVIHVQEIDPARTVSEDLWPVVQQYAFDEWLSAQRAQATIRVNRTIAVSQ
ncbi:MAG: peptidylprolyl isomerase [Anaerolineae bacterium]